MSRAPWYQWLRIGFAALTFAAVIRQLQFSLDLETFKVSNFLSFFTIQSNLIAAVVLLVGAVMVLRGSGTSSTWEYVRGAAVAYMSTTGIVFAALLAGLPDDLDLTLPWVNFVLHQLMPIVLVADWLFSPPRRSLEFRRALPWMIYPIAYLAYSLIRGPIVGWYPYPFLDPDEVGGYLGVAAYSIGIAVLFIGLIWLVVALGNRANAWWGSGQRAPELAR